MSDPVRIVVRYWTRSGKLVENDKVYLVDARKRPHFSVFRPSKDPIPAEDEYRADDAPDIVDCYETGEVVMRDGYPALVYQEKEPSHD